MGVFRPSLKLHKPPIKIWVSQCIIVYIYQAKDFILRDTRWRKRFPRTNPSSQALHESQSHLWRTLLVKGECINKQVNCGMHTALYQKIYITVDTDGCSTHQAVRARFCKCVRSLSAVLDLLKTEGLRTSMGLKYCAAHNTIKSEFKGRIQFLGLDKKDVHAFCVLMPANLLKTMSMCYT